MSECKTKLKPLIFKCKDERKERMERVIKAIKNSKAYIVVAWDGKVLPAFWYDVVACTKEEDLRHFLMQSLAEEVECAHDMAKKALNKEPLKIPKASELKI